MSIETSSPRLRISTTSLYEIYRQKVWDACVPIQIRLDPDEITTILPKELQQDFLHHSKVKPFCAMIPRTSFFPFLQTQIQRHFYSYFSTLSRFVPQITPWLEYQGHPLKWQYFIGHLWDISISQGREMGPWCLTVHLTDYPSSLLPLGTVEEGGGSISTHYHSMLKQADFLRHGSCKTVNALSKADQTQLWDALWTHSYDRFNKVHLKILGDEGVVGALKSGWKSYPIRIYLIESGKEVRIIQRPFNSSQCHTLADLTRLIDLSEDHIVESVVSHGVKLLMDTQLSWLSLYFCYPDGFLHLIVKLMCK